MSKKPELIIYKAFVSSTYEDLKNHRAFVINVLRKSGFFVDPMEDWTSSVDEPKEFSKRRIEGCDLCILLVALRRGFIPNGTALSITQLEYTEAINRGIDVLVYMLDEEALWYRNFDETHKDPQLWNWREILKLKHG